MGTVYARVEHKYSFGEDETALFDYEENLDVEERPIPRSNVKLKGVKARVDRVNVDGLRRTKDDIVRGTVDDMFNAKDFEDVIARAHKVRQALDDLGCFGNICVYIDVSSGPEATPDGLEVTFQVRELRRASGGLGTSVGDDEGSLVLGMKFPNMLGRGERAQAAYSVGYRSTTNFHVTATKPLPLKTFYPVLSASLYQQSQEFPCSGYSLLSRGLLLDATFKTAPTTKHSVQWEGLLRDMTVVNKTSFKIRENSGPQLKSVVRHTITMDQRDDVVFPTRGVWMQVSNELAGVGGGVANLKAELRLQANRTLSEDAGIVLQATGALGVLHDVYGTSLADHFFLGGPTTLPGFQQRGVGPHVDGQAIGGRVYWAGGLHVFAPLPMAGARSGVAALFRSHFFANAGCLVLPESASLLSSRTAAALGAWRAALGAGVCARVGRARLELSYVVPLRALAADRTAPGLQLGLAAHFL